MRRLDMTDVCVVYAGEEWRHALPPCSKEMMSHLERNEKLVSWLQPLKGTVQDQLPAIRYNDEFYSISLRMMKAIWRHVRLRKGFNNVERAPYGGLKLKIPVTLLAEKLRTQSRFNVMRMSSSHIASPAIKERKVSLSASCKIDNIIRQLFLPMLSMPTPERTSFLAEDADDQLLRQVAQEKPGVLASEVAFVDYMVLLYRKFQRESIAFSDASRFCVAESSDCNKTISIASSPPTECHECQELCELESCGSHASECCGLSNCSGFRNVCGAGGSRSSHERNGSTGSGANQAPDTKKDSGADFKIDSRLDSKVDFKSVSKPLRKSGALNNASRTHSKGQAKPKAVQRNRVRSQNCPKTTDDCATQYLTSGDSDVHRERILCNDSPTPST